MLDIKDFFSFEDQASFDFKGLLIKLKLLEMVLLSLIITSPIRSIFAKGVYSMETLISVKEESNPCLRQIRVLFLTGVELLTRFQISTTIQSRSHNELVVDKLQYYINYMVQGKYALEDAYGAVPLC
jgi:hypothetical protein